MNVEGRVKQEDGPNDIAFDEVTASFAVDVSTSTRILCLEQEIKVCREIQSLFTPSKQNETRVLPWSGHAGAAISVREIGTLRISYGTDPTVIYGAEQLEVLRNSSLWFLLTDGQIASNLVKAFAQQTLRHGIHGTACVIITFGAIRNDGIRPADADISVGMSIFALAADCLYLYHNTFKPKDASINFSRGDSSSPSVQPRRGLTFLVFHTATWQKSRFLLPRSWPTTRSC